VLVQLREPHLGLDAIGDVGHRDRHGRPAQRPRRTQPLEPVQRLELIALGERDDRRELPVALERAAHGVERGGLAQPQGGESLAQLGDAGDTRRWRARGHGRIRAPPAATVRCRRVTRAHLRRDSLGITRTPRSKPARDSRAASATIRCTLSCNSAGIAAEAGA
jgi:hypothetical protein